MTGSGGCTRDGRLTRQGPVIVALAGGRLRLDNSLRLFSTGDVGFHRVAAIDGERCCSGDAPGPTGGRDDAVALLEAFSHFHAYLVDVGRDEFVLHVQADLDNNVLELIRQWGEGPPAHGDVCVRLPGGHTVAVDTGTFAG